MTDSGSMPAKIALFLPSLAGGGAERVFVDLANQFSALGHRVDLVLAAAEGPYVNEVHRQVRVVDLRAGRVMRALPRLVRYLRRERPAALLSGLDHSNIVATVARKLAGTPTRCVVSVRSMPSAVYGPGESRRRRSVGGLMKIAYRLADSIVANSEAVAADLAGHAGFAAGSVRVIHNPLDLDRIAQQARLPVIHEWAHAGAPIILGVGSLTAFKDFGTLITAFARVRALRACRLVILGEGPERLPLERLVRELGLADDVRMPGFDPNPFAWMRLASVFVSSSVTEGCPNAVMQALAVGAPIVATEGVGGSAEVL